MRKSRLVGTSCAIFLFAFPVLSDSSADEGAGGLVDVRVVTDEADTVLGLLEKRARGEALTESDWRGLHETEGYQRLKARNESFGAEAFAERFRDWILEVDLDLLEQMRSGVDRWRDFDAALAGGTAHAYLPEGTRLRATVYPVLKRTPNSFVHDVRSDPAIFMYVSGEEEESEIANTLAHELHHIGAVAGCAGTKEEPPSEAAGQVLRWMGGFGEGLAMLAAAGGPDIHPHTGREQSEWLVWERDIARFSEDVRRIERFFLDILAGKLSKEDQRARFMELINSQDVPQGPFYTVGWKMGALVEKRFGRQAVIASVCDMPRLLVGYNQIAHELETAEDGKLPRWDGELLRAIGAPDLVGTWRGRPEHNDQVGDFVIRFELGGDGDLQAVVSLPSLGAWDVARLPATIEDNRVEIGSWFLERTPDGGLLGKLPTSLVPVHQVPIALHRVEKMVPPEEQRLDAPIAEPLWKRQLGSPVWAGLSTGVGLLYVGSDDGVLRALDPTTGEDRWHFATAGAIRAQPTVTDELLYVHSDDGFLYALEAESGEKIWQARVSSTPVERIPLGAEGNRYNHYASSAVSDRETIYIGGFDGRLYALDAETGAERWHFETGDTIAGTPAITDGRVVFGSFDGTVYAVDAESGDEVWRYETGAAVVSSPLVHDGRAIIGSRTYDLLALDTATGALDWKYYYWFSWVESSAVAHEGVAYVGSSDGQLVVALDAESGEEKWRFDSGGSPWSRPSVTDTSVFIGTVGVADYMVAHEGDILALDRETGRPRWHHPLQRPGQAGHWGVGASSAVDGGRVFFATLSGQVLAFEEDSPGAEDRAGS